MDSPEGNRIVSTSSASPTVQESPFSNYLSTLSPIKPVKSFHLAQGFSELNFPPPPPVFTSPQINTQRKASFLKRPQFSHSSNAELSQHDDSGKMVAAASDIYSSSQKECDSKCSIQVQACSPGCVDEFLADPVDPEDSVNSIDSANLCLKQSNDASEALENSSSLKENIENINDNIDNREGTDSETMAASLTSLEQAEDKVAEKLLFPDNPVESEAEQQKDSGRLPDEYQGVISEKISAHLESDLSIKHVSFIQNDKNLVVQIAKELSSIIAMEGEHGDADFDKRQRSSCSTNPCQHRLEDVMLQNAEGGQQDEWDCTPQLLPESLQISQASRDHDKKSGLISNGSLESKMQCNFEEASQHQRGTLRRCLQFEAAEGCRNIAGSCCSHPTNMTPGTSTDLGDPDLCNLGPSAASSPKQPPDLSQLAASKLSQFPVQNSEMQADKADKSVRDYGNASVIAPVPTGIGLHLNSIVHSSAKVTGVTASMKLVEKCSVIVQGQKSFCVINSHFQEDSKSNPLQFRMVGEISSNTDDDQQESQATILASSASSQVPDSMKAVKNSQQLKLMECHSIPSHKRKSASESADMFEEFNQPSHKKGRKKESCNSQNEGCKRCNCKRSKCLKLYCECFAAGVYCADLCACQECFNKPEYEETVLGIRQQIESRNPLAFAPKIVQLVSESSANSGVEDSNRMTPSSARHKRGCNCKRSLCLKKYCECYQSGVGCSEACRCERCKNVYGVKEELIYKRAVDERWEGLSNEKLDTVEARSDTSHWEHSHPHSLSPLALSFDCSKKKVPKPRVPGRRCLPSPESDSSALSSYGKSTRSPRNKYESQQKTSTEVLDIVPYDQDLDCIKAGKVNQFSPRWDGLADICNLTPLPHPPSRATSSLVSSNTSDPVKVSRAPSSRRSGHLSSVSSLQWHSSPITPMSHSGGNNFTPELDSENGLCDILGDDTPEILKDTATPINVVKASSPNKKRVSPPHSRLHELRSNSSLALRSGRKFILRAIPSFPPLTPDSDPKSSSGDK